MTFDVCIIKTDSGKVIKRIPTDSRFQAVKVERGANINLNRDEYHTEIRKGLTKNVSA